jgi:phosphoribosylanthranilate isomerase
MEKLYVGITGATSFSDVETLYKAFDSAGYSMESSHMPMMGFVLKENQPIEDVLPLLGVAHRWALGLISYIPKEMETLYQQIAHLFTGVYESGLCRAVQLNTPWPDRGQVGKIMDSFPEMKIVFQASREAMEGKTPKEIASGIKEYGSDLSYVLIDPSSGRGIDFDLAESVALHLELREQAPKLAVGFAGGLTGDNVAERLRDIKGWTGGSNFSIDAESGVKSIPEAVKYLNESASVLLTD